MVRGAVWPRRRSAELTAGLPLPVRYTLYAVRFPDPGFPLSSAMTSPERAAQIWQALVSAGFYRQTLTYTMLADRIGLDTAYLAEPLGMVARYCAMKQLPPLPVLVVRSDAGTPATEFSWATDVDFAREAVYQHEWFKLRPPSAQDFQLLESMGFGEPAA
jgi:hypothetical protein